MAAPNWAEVRHIVERRVGAARWRQTRQRLLGLPIEIVPTDRTRAERPVRWMSLADGFPAALARQRKADIHTGDPELRAAERDVRIAWLTH